MIGKGRLHFGHPSTLRRLRLPRGAAILAFRSRRPAFASSCLTHGHHGLVSSCAPSLSARRSDLRIALRDALLLPVDDFGLQPADGFWPDRDRPGERAVIHLLVDRSAAKPGSVLNLLAAKNSN